MAEIIPKQEERLPQGNFEGWTEGKSKAGKTYYYRAVDSGGKTKPPEEDAAGKKVGASGPPFTGVQCNWASGTSGSTDDNFVKQTAISFYVLSNTIGWTYQLTIMAKDTYDYFFHTDNDSYELDVWQTNTTHEVTFSTWHESDATIVYVDGD